MDWLIALLFESCFIQFCKMGHCSKITLVSKMLSLESSIILIVTPVHLDSTGSQFRSRIHFKIGLITYKALHFGQSTSLKNLISVHTSPLNLRSTTSLKLKHGPIAKSFGSRAFSYFAPEVRNKLPTIVCKALSISVFRKHLKLTILYIPHSTAVSLAASSGLDPLYTWTAIFEHSLDLYDAFELVLSNKSVSKIFHSFIQIYYTYFYIYSFQCELLLDLHGVMIQLSYTIG